MTREELLKTAKPILFNTDMVRVILDGRKSVTRRKIDIDISNQFDVDVDGSVICYTDQDGDVRNPKNIARYKSGDILYVRETFLPFKNTVYYKADKKYEELETLGVKFKWHPSVHMPKEAARIFLKVTDVRVERLKDVTEEQAKREGFIPSYEKCGLDDCAKRSPTTLGDHSCPKNCDCRDTIENFLDLWDSTVKKQDLELYGWDANPWAFVYEFERIEVEE